MLYLNINDTSIEVIQTNKSLIGAETITAVSRREIPDGLIINGMIADTEKLVGVLNEIFSSAYPKSIKDKTVSLLISDKQAFTSRFMIDAPSDDLAKSVIDQVKKVLPYDPTELENFYKVIGEKDNKKEIFYAAMAKNAILNFSRFLSKNGIKLTFLTSRSISLFVLMKYIVAEEESVLYCEVNKKAVEFTLFDKNGIIESFEKKHGVKSFSAEVKAVIKSYIDNKNIKIQKVILAGNGAIEIHSLDVSDMVGIPVVKMGDIIEEILQKTKLVLDTGGLPKMLFVNTLSLILFSASNSPANFIADFSPDVEATSDSSKLAKETEKKEILTEEKKTPEVKTVSDVSTMEMTDQIISPVVEEKRNINKLVIFGIAAFVGIIIFVLVFFLIQKSKETGTFNFFQAKPTLTPVPTIIPTMTPTPTIDPQLKRSNLKISVQNGTEKSGYEKDIATYLEEKGYKNVAKSNADKTDYDTSLISIKADKVNYTTLLVVDLKEKIDTTTIKELAADSKFDAVVVLGKK